MKFYKLEEFTLSARKFEKSKFFNGQSDIERKFNPGFIEFKNLLDYLSSLYDEVLVNVFIIYQNQTLSYYLGIKHDDPNQMQSIETTHSSWKLTNLPNIPEIILDTLIGACHISTADEAELNLIDEIVRLSTEVKNAPQTEV